MRRSFWVAVAVSAGAIGILGALAGVLLTEVAACQMAIFGRPSLQLCAQQPWPSSWVPWVLLVASVALVASVLVVGIVTAWRQVSRARRHVRALASSSVDATDGLLATAAFAGIERLVLVDAPGCIAVTHGLLRPVVVVSTGLVEALDPDELGAVLAHEAEHVGRRDPLRLLVARTIAAALWPFPALRDLAEHGALGSEITADRAAASSAGLRPLASALHRVLSAPAVADTFAASSIDGLRHRIHGLGRPDDPPLELSRGRLAWSGVSSGLVVAAITVLVFAALPVDASQAAAAEPPPSGDAREVIPVGDRDGHRVGWIRQAELDELAEHGGAGRVPVRDADGVQVGWFVVETGPVTGPEGGFRPLEE